MPKPLSFDLRERAVSRFFAGESVRSVAAVFQVSVSSVVKWSQRYRATVSVAPGRAAGRPRPSLLAPHRAFLFERTGSGEHVTLRGLQAELAGRGTKVDYRAVWNFVHAEGLSFKKSVLPSKQRRPDIARRRAQWKKYQGRLDPRRLVFIDAEADKQSIQRIDCPPMLGQDQHGSDPRLVATRSRPEPDSRQPAPQRQ